MIGKGLHKSDLDRFSRDWWISGARTLLWVAVVTILIWVYADMRFTDRRTLPATVRLSTAPGSQLTLMKNGSMAEAVERRVQFTVKGSREALDRFERDFQTSNVIDWKITSDRGAGGEVSFSTQDLITSDPRVAKYGVAVTAPDPPSVAVRLDRLVHQELPVELVVSGAELASPPKAPTVGVTVSQQQWRTILDSHVPVALKTKEADLTNKPTGVPVEVEFEIFPQIAGVPVKLDSSVIKVPVEIRRRTASKTLTVSVRVLMPSDWEDTRKYELVRKDPLEWRPEITVTGSTTDLDKLDAKDVDAYIVLREDDRKPMETWTARTVTIRFPPNLQVQLEREPPQVNFRIDRRPATTEPAAP